MNELEGSMEMVMGVIRSCGHHKLSRNNFENEIKSKKLNKFRFSYVIQAPNPHWVDSEFHQKKCVTPECLR